MINDENINRDTIQDIKDIDIISFTSDVMGVKLNKYQQIILEQLSSDNKPVYLVMSAHCGQSYAKKMAEEYNNILRESS